MVFEGVHIPSAKCSKSPPPREPHQTAPDCQVVFLDGEFVLILGLKNNRLLLSLRLCGEHVPHMEEPLGFGKVFCKQHLFSIKNFLDAKIVPALPKTYKILMRSCKKLPNLIPKPGQSRTLKRPRDKTVK